MLPHIYPPVTILSTFKAIAPLSKACLLNTPQNVPTKRGIKLNVKARLPVFTDKDKLLIENCITATQNKDPRFVQILQNLSLANSEGRGLGSSVLSGSKNMRKCCSLCLTIYVISGEQGIV